MITHKLIKRIQKNGYLELNNLPFRKGTKLEVIMSKKDKINNLQKLISNDHVWSEEDIKAVDRGRILLQICDSIVFYLWNKIETNNPMGVPEDPKLSLWEVIHGTNDNSSY